MEPFEQNMSSPDDATFQSPLPWVEVHVLSEFVFCPRAAILAFETGRDTGEEEPPRTGPKLDFFADYDEHRFVEALHKAWGSMRLWATLLAPALLLIFAAWRLHSAFAAVIVSLPLFVLAAKLWETLCRLVSLVREYSAYKAAAPVEIDLRSLKIRDVNWWSLRKAGFDCFEPQASYQLHAEQLSGKPWRVLTKETATRIPVVRKHRGQRRWRQQHVVRLAAYCQLIEACEGANAPLWPINVRRFL